MRKDKNNFYFLHMILENDIDENDIMKMVLID